MTSRRHKEQGFTLIEIIFVILIIVVVYSVAIPQFSLITGTEVAEKMGTLAEDIRASFDMAVLKNKPHRLVFDLKSGEYWLEEADRREIYVGDEKVARDSTAEEDAQQEEAFKESMEQYESLAGQEFKDADNEKTLKPFSPLLAAQDQLKPIKWKKIENMEWRSRSIGPSLEFRYIQAEHHATKQSLETTGEGGRAMLYFFPQGYIEQCVMVIASPGTANNVDPNEGAYTLTCNSYEGTASVEPGQKEVEFKERDQT